MVVHKYMAFSINMLPLVPSDFHITRYGTGDRRGKEYEALLEWQWQGKKPVSQCYSVHEKSYTPWSSIKTGAPWREVSN